MCPEVRVHVRLGAVRLQFEGEQSFYESHVEGLLEAAAGRPASAPAPKAPAPAPVPAAAAPARQEPAPWAPQSAEFGKFIRRLGPEAGEHPERQVVAFGFYLWNYERKETFTRRDVEGCFRALHLPVPELPPLFEDLTERKRFLEKATDDAWRLSKKGEAYVKTRLLTT